MSNTLYLVTVSPDYNPLVMNVNVGGTKNIINCCKKHSECKKLVYCSSTGAIPEEKKGKKIKEVIYFDEDQTVGCYSRSKAIASQAVLDAANIDGLNACIAVADKGKRENAIFLPMKKYHLRILQSFFQKNQAVSL